MTRNLLLARIGWLSLAVLSVAALNGTAHAQATGAPAGTQATSPAVDRDALLQQFNALAQEFDAAYSARDAGKCQNLIQQLYAAYERYRSATKDGSLQPAYMERRAQEKSLREAFPSVARLDAELSASEADADAGNIEEVNARLRAISGLLDAARPALTDDRALAVARRIDALKTKVVEWKTARDEQARQEKLESEIRAELAQLDSDLIRAEKTGDPDAAETRIAAVLKGLDAAEAKAAALRLVPTDRVKAQIAKIRADAANARRALVAQREETRARLAIDAAQDALEDLPPAGVTVESAERCASLVGEARAAAEAAKSVSAEVRKRLDDAIRRLELRLSQIRATIQEEGASQRFEEAMEKCDDETLKAESLIGQGASRDDLDRATELLAGAQAALRAAAEDPTPVRSPSASRANEARLKRSAGRIEAGRRRIEQLRNSLDLADALIAARGHMASLERALWAGDVATINGLVGKPGVTAAQAAEAQMVLKDLNSHGAFYPSIEDDCQAIEADIDAWKVLSAQEKLDKLIKRADSDEFSAAHKAFIRDVCARFKALIRQLWTIIVLLALAVVLLVVSLTMLLRRGSGSGSMRNMGQQIVEGRRRLAERRRELENQMRQGPPTEQIAASDRLRRISDSATTTFVPAIRGARMPRALWMESYALVMQLTAAGDGAAAQKLMMAVCASGVLPKPPLLGREPWYVRHDTRLAHGSRAAEAAFAWGEVWRASSDLESKKAADAEVVRWYALAVQWLDRDNDVWVLYRQARHEKDLGRFTKALDLLVMRGPEDSSGKSAESRFTNRASSVPRELKARVLLLAAQVQLEVAGVVSLEPLPFRSTLAEWPTREPQRGPAVSATSRYDGVRAPTKAPAESSPLDAAEELVFRAAAEIVNPGQTSDGSSPDDPSSQWGGPPAGGAGASASRAPGSSPAAPSRVPDGPEREELVLRWALASFRHALATNLSSAEQILQKHVLREQAPTAFGFIQFGLGPNDPALLLPGWSRIEGNSKVQLSAESRALLRELRINWVRWCIGRAQELPAGSEDRNTRLREAAWLTCRYLLSARSDSGISAVERDVFEHRLRDHAFRLLDIPPNSQSSPGPGAWAPRDEQDQRIYRALLDFVNVHVLVGPPWFVDLNQKLGELVGQTWPWTQDEWALQGVLGEMQRVLKARRERATPEEATRIDLLLKTVDEWLKPPPPPPQKSRPSNIFVQMLSSETRRPGTDAPAVNSVRIVDPTNSTADLGGDIAWIDFNGSALKAVGVFGHQLNEFYSVPLKSEDIAVDTVLGTAASFIGTMKVLAEMTFDGLPELPGEFHVVLSSEVVRSGWGLGGIGGVGYGSGGYGSGLGAGLGTAANPKDRPEWKRVKVPRTARPAPGKEPPAIVSPAAIEKSLFDISLVIASVSLDAAKMPLAATAQLEGSADAWRHLVSFFRTELGVAEKQVRDELAKRAGAGTADLDLSSVQQSLLDVEFIKSLVRQLRLRDSATCHREAELAWSKMDPAVRSAIDRLLRKFAARHKTVLTAAALLRFGIKLDVPPKPSTSSNTSTSTSTRTEPDRREWERGKPDGKQEGIYRDFRLLAADACDATGGSRQWSYANDPATLRRILADMAATLEGFMVSTSDSSRKASLAALIARIRAFEGQVS